MAGGGTDIAVHILGLASAATVGTWILYTLATAQDWRKASDDRSDKIAHGDWPHLPSVEKPPVDAGGRAFITDGFDNHETRSSHKNEGRK